MKTLEITISTLYLLVLSLGFTKGKHQADPVLTRVGKLLVKLAGRKQTVGAGHKS